MPSLPYSAVKRRGLMLVLSAPSGGGKSTIARALLERDPGLSLSVSVTTRKPRPGECEGIHYFFRTIEQFDELVAQGEMLEHARVFDNRYGTPRGPVENALTEGRDVLFDIDWQGNRQLADNARADLVSVFILPPSLAELERRLNDRNQDSAEVVAKRMAEAADEISHWAEYDYVVVNTDLEESIAAVQAILRAERLKRVRRVGLGGFIDGMLKG
ncbi:guanylate kinase [Novispirillum sp. DQ9]|uniref:guanylate kinase n=1 Tax=Novispirillum sp. DQ9 TaxID=3398612 RepID=UPI003C7CDB7B